MFIEPVPSTYIGRVDVSGDMYGTGMRTCILYQTILMWDLVNMTVLSSDTSYQNVKVSVFDGKSSSPVATASGTSDQPFTFSVGNPSLWTPNTPTLYNITVTLGQDTVVAYTGFRSLSKGSVNGVTRPLLNGEFIFAFGTLE